MLTKEDKKEVLQVLKKEPGDTGSAVVQIALLTKRIDRLSDHFKGSPKDFVSKQGFLKLVGQRRRLLNYLKKNSRKDYQMITEKYKIK